MTNLPIFGRDRKPGQAGGWVGQKTLVCFGLVGLFWYCLFWAVLVQVARIIGIVRYVR